MPGAEGPRNELDSKRAPLVLIASEHEWSARSLDTVLAPRGYAMLRAYNAAQVMERARSSDPDVVFLDWKLPGANGITLARELTESGAVSRATPVILVGDGPLPRDQRLAALRSGAWEVISFPADAEEIVLRINNYISAKRSLDQTREQGLIDEATGFYSRTGLTRRLKELAASAERSGAPLTCVVLQLDGSAPDPDVVTRVAARLRGAIRGSDVAGRIGPGGFLVLAPETPEEGAAHLAERMRTAGLAGDPEARVHIYSIANGDAAKPQELLHRLGQASSVAAS